MRKTVFLLALTLTVSGPALASASAQAGSPPPALPQTDEDARREAAIAEFTRKMKAANYPALFEKAAREFNVPADILKGIAFAETRWEQLTWPPGETASPDTGMPRPYGIMSLWDNQYFGHSLIEAAKLIGGDPEVLKQDPLQNMRGAAALLRKIYDETPKPKGTTEADIESWRYAIRKYCGIPQPDLNAQHALDVYVFMSQGYHQYGIEWDARPVNLEPIREETRRIIAEERAKRQALEAAGSNAPPPQLSATASTGTQVQSNRTASPPPAQPSGPARLSAWWFIGGALLAFLAILLASRTRSKPQ